MDKSNLALVVVTFLLFIATVFMAYFAYQQGKLTNFVVKPKANLDFICPKLDENGEGLTNVTFWNDGGTLGHFFVRVDNEGMLVSIPPLLYNVREGCVASSDGGTYSMLLGSGHSKVYPLMVHKEENLDTSFTVSIKCQSDLCLKDQALSLTCFYPTKNQNLIPKTRTWPVDNLC